MLMALLPMAGFALTLDGSKFSCLNIDYGATALPAVAADGYTLTTQYTVEADYFYTSDTGAGRTAIGAEGATLAKTKKGKYYRKVLGAGDYEGQTVYVDFWINGIDVDLTITGGIFKTYGEDDPEIEFTLVKHGTTTEVSDAGLTIIREAGEDVKAGGYAFTVTCTNENYDVTRTDASVFTIYAKDISATATIAAEQGDIVYKGIDFAGVYTVMDGETELVAGKDYTVSTVKNVTANYKPTITFQGNYEGSKTAATGFAVTQAPIIVGVEDLEANYDGTTDYHVQTGAAATKLTYSGFVGDDVANAATLKGNFNTTGLVVVTTAATAINAGEYDLEITGVTNGTNANYKIETYIPGKLTVKQADLVIRSANATKAMGTADPEFKLIDYTPLTITGVTFTREPGEAAGEYTITPNTSGIVVKRGDAIVTTNYNITVADATLQGKLTIGKTQIYVTVKDNNKFYGEDDPDFDYSVIGISKTDLGAVTITREKAGTDEGEAVGAYTLSANVANPDASKYLDPIVANGIFTIKKAELTFVMPAQNLAIGKKVTDLSKAAITVTGIKKEADKADNGAALYELSFHGVSLDTEDKTDANETIADGIYATLTAEAQANYVVIGDNKLDVDADPEYEVAFGKIIVGTGGGAGVVLAGTDADYEGVIKARAGETVPTVSVTITGRNARKINATDAEHPWTAETWNTMVLPFEVTVAELSGQLSSEPGVKPGYAIVNVVNPEKTTETNVQFKLEMQTIPANTPFCVKTSEDIPEGATLNFANKLIVDGGEYPSVPASSDAIGYKFVGAYKSLTVDKTTPNYHFLRGDNANWAHFGASSANSWTVLPYDAYIDQSGAASAPELTFTFQEIDGSFTAIKSVDSDAKNLEPAKTGWYTIGGMKLQNAPTQKGVYIKDGKKVIVK